MKFLIKLAILLSLTSCASFLNSNRQIVIIKTIKENRPVADSNCILSNDKGYWNISQTPTTVRIKKSYEDLSIECTHKNKDLKGLANFQSKHGTAVYGNIIFFAAAPIGFAVDKSTGAGFSYPSIITVEMK